MSKKAEEAIKPARKHFIEDSIHYRIVSSTMALIGIVAASQEADTPLWLFLASVAGTIAGSIFSYRVRYQHNRITKIFLTIGILLIATVFFNELLMRIASSIADARIPLTNMLIALQGLHCFDLPRRRDLSVSALVGLTLIASAATLSRDMFFGVYLFSFLSLAFLMLKLDSESRHRERAEQESFGIVRETALLQPYLPDASGKASRTVPGRQAVMNIRPAIDKGWQIALVGVGLSLTLFFIMPRPDMAMTRNIRVAAKFDLPFFRMNFMNAVLKDKIISPDGSITRPAKAYYGFSEELDLNFRGQLTNEVVMRVSCRKGQLWRGMAFDTFDGQRWTMSRPKSVQDRIATAGEGIKLAPLPSFERNGPLNAEPLLQIFYVESEAPNLVLTASIPQQIYFPAMKLQVDEYGSIRSPVGVEKDMVYTVISHQLAATEDDIRKIETAPYENKLRFRQRFDRYLQVPASMSPQVKNIAGTICTASHWFDKARQIQDYLRHNCTYDLEAPIPKPDQDAVTHFLIETKRGYCEQFATTFIMMCRSQNIPARLVTGFIPGEYNPFTGLWTVHMSDAHAWAEIYIPRRGWITFDPTPGGLAPAYNGQDRNTAFGYLFDAIGHYLHMLRTAPVLVAIKKYFLQIAGHNLLLPICSLLAGLAAVFYFYKCFDRLKLKLGSLRLHKQEQGQAITPGYHSSSRQEIIAEYERFLKELDKLKLPRAKAETATELAARLKTAVATAEIELEERINRYLNNYTASRFGQAVVSTRTMAGERKKIIAGLKTAKQRGVDSRSCQEEKQRQAKP